MQIRTEKLCEHDLLYQESTLELSQFGNLEDEVVCHSEDTVRERRGGSSEKGRDRDRDRDYRDRETSTAIWQTLPPPSSFLLPSSSFLLLLLPPPPSPSSSSLPL